MKIKLFAAAAAVACAMSAAPAFAGDGFVDAAYLHVNVSGAAGSVSGYQADGAFSTEPAAGAIGFQGDVTFLDADGATGSYIAGTGTVYHQGDKSRLGAYVSYADVFGDSAWEAGVVGQLINENFTLSALLGYGDNDAPGSNSYWNMGAAASFYINKNVALTAFGGFSDPEFLGGSANVVGVNLEVKPESLPVSLFAGYSRTNPGGAASTTDLISVGARFNFGGKTLKDRDQKALIKQIGLRQGF